MKWSKFRGGERAKSYELLVDLFFELVGQNQVHFHCLIAEFGKFSHGAFEGGDPESSVNRMYFQLLVHRICRFYAGKCYIFVYPDDGNDSKDLQKFHGQINLAAKYKYGMSHRIVRIEQVDSASCNLIQMVPTRIGVVRFEMSPKARIRWPC
jgi:hypothetical protein